MSGVDVTDVEVRYGSQVALGPISLHVEAGSWLCLIGPNGAGKTSLLHAISGLVAHRGSIRVNGQSLDRLRPSRRARLVALVPQQPTVPIDLSVIDYALLGRTPHISVFGTETAHDRSVTASVLERLDLLGLADRQLGTLSGGELQRVLLARALTQATPVLLLDEPTTALDLGRQQQVLRLIDELRVDYALTIVTTMHDLTLAGAYADTLVLLDCGSPVANGNAVAVLTEPILRRYYHADIQVLHTADGTLAVVPVHPHRRTGPTGNVDHQTERS